MKNIEPKSAGVVLLLLFSVPSIVVGAAGTEGASFLNIPVGGAPVSMGGAYSALARDAYAPVFNPGGLGFLPSSQFAATHLSYVDSMSYEFASLVHPLARGHGIGISAQLLRPGDTAATDINGNPAGEFSGLFAAYSAGYGFRIGSRVGLGVVGKLIDAKIAGERGNAYAADAGVMVTATERLTLSAVAANIGSKLKFREKGDSLPAAFRLGGAYGPWQNFTFALQGTQSKDEGFSAQTGVQWTPISLLAFRVGYNTQTTKELSGSAGISAGVGFSLAGQKFDYAYSPSSDLGNEQYFSMVLQWGNLE